MVILGGLVGDPITKRYPEQSALVNDKAIFDTIDCLDGANVGRVVFVSTCSNYGLMPEGQIAHENSDLNPLSLYAKSKVNAEKHLLGKKGDASYSATILRFATAFGLAPRMRFDLTVNEFTRDVFLQKDLWSMTPTPGAPTAMSRTSCATDRDNAVRGRRSGQLRDFQRRRRCQQPHQAQSDRRHRTISADRKGELQGRWR